MKEKIPAKVKAHTRYKLKDGSRVPGITTVLNLRAKNALVKWSNDLGLRGISVGAYVDDLADIGTLAHAFITDHLTGQETDISDYSPNQVSLAENSVLSFWEWEEDHKIEEVFFCERPLVSEIHRFGGTLDIYAKVNGKREIIDLKSGSGIYNEAVWQVATLKVLLEENGFPVDGTRIVNIPRAETEAFLEKTVSQKENETGWSIFQHLLAVYYLEK